MTADPYTSLVIVVILTVQYVNWPEKDISKLVFIKYNIE